MKGALHNLGRATRGTNTILAERRTREWEKSQFKAKPERNTQVAWASRPSLSSHSAAVR